MEWSAGCPCRGRRSDLALIFASVFLTVLAGVLAGEAVIAGRHRRVLRLLARSEEGRVLSAHGRRVAEAVRRASHGVFADLLFRLAPYARGPTGGETAKRLAWGGSALTAEQFAALRMLAAGFGALMSLLAGAALLAIAGGVPLGVIGALAGYALPDLWLGAAITRRRRLVDRELLYFVDLLALTASAGMSLDTAVTRVAAEFPGLLSAAFDQMQRQRGMGQWSEHALAEVSGQFGHKDLDALCQTLTRAGRFGSRAAAALHELAAGLRRERHLSAQEHANRAGAAIVLPVAIFIMPSILLILGYPAMALVGGALTAH